MPTPSRYLPRSKVRGPEIKIKLKCCVFDSSCPRRACSCTCVPPLPEKEHWAAFFCVSISGTKTCTLGYSTIVCDCPLPGCPTTLLTARPTLFERAQTRFDCREGTYVTNTTATQHRLHWSFLSMALSGVTPISTVLHRH